MKTYSLLLIFVFGFILLSGCAKQETDSYAKSYYDIYLANPLAIYNASQVGSCNPGSCICYLCENSTSWFGWYTSLVGGRCWFEKDCNQEKFLKIWNQTYDKIPNTEPTSLALRQFMIGQGASFSDFSDANPWCNNRLDMAVQWLVGDKDNDYSLPDSDRAKCMLDKGVIPVYVLYSNSSNIDADASYRVASRLYENFNPILSDNHHVGPVIITTEIDFNISNPKDPLIAKKIVAQIKAINSGCKNVRDSVNPSNSKVYCMVALAPRLGDGAALQEILVNQKMADQVDLIAYGINSHYETSCDPDRILSQRALNYSKFVLNNYSKPTIIPYILFDADKDASGTCTWSESLVQDGYKKMFGLFLVAALKNGVIGMSPYDFNSTARAFSANPLKCTDCALGKNADRMASWFGFCQKHKSVTSLSATGATSYSPSGDLLAVFPNASGAFCDWSWNLQEYIQLSYGSSSDHNIMVLNTPTLSASSTGYFRCDSCVNENIKFPFSLGGTASVGTITSGPNAGKTYCEVYPEIEWFAANNNLDPMLVRALVARESGFDPCSAAVVKESGGLDPGCYPKAYDEVVDPAGVCKKATATGFTNGKPTSRYCALGLMQSLESPYTYWPAKYTESNGGFDGRYYLEDATCIARYSSGTSSANTRCGYKNVVEVAGRSEETSLAYACNPKFNPFNASDSICVGTSKLAERMKSAESEIDDFIAGTGGKSKLLSSLYLKSIKDNSNTLKVIQYYFALNMYRGHYYTSKGSAYWGDQWVVGFDETLKAWDKQSDWGNTAKACEGDPSDPTLFKNPNMAVACNSVGKPKTCSYGGETYRYDEFDFIKYARVCHIKKDNKPAYASEILQTYVALTDTTKGCPQASCPSWKRLTTNLCSNSPASGTINYPNNESDGCVPAKYVPPTPPGTTINP